MGNSISFDWFVPVKKGSLCHGNADDHKQLLVALQQSAMSRRLESAVRVLSFPFPTICGFCGPEVLSREKFRRAKAEKEDGGRSLNSPQFPAPSALVVVW